MTNVVFTPALSPANVPPGSVLAIGVDVAWWGGAGGKASTQTETLAYAVRRAGRWRELGLERLQLTPTPADRLDRFTANADPHAVDLANGIERVVAAHGEVDHVIVGVDAPILCRPRRLPKRMRDEIPPATCADRDADAAFRAQIKQGPPGWRDVNIYAGAPLVPRIEGLVRALTKRRFRIYGGPSRKLPRRALVECFPNDAFWTAGVLTSMFDGFTFRDARTYKKLHTIARVWHARALREMTDFYLRPPATVARLPPKTIDAWIERVWKFFEKDAHVTKRAGAVMVGKAYDDAIDSVLSLLCATALADGCAHVHIGDPADGHIVGPGLP